MGGETIAVVIGTVLSITSTVVGIINTRRSGKSFEAAEMAPRIVEEPVFRDKVRLITADQLQVHLNHENYARESDIALLSSRLGALEKRIDTIPGEVGHQVAMSMRGFEQTIQSLTVEIRSRGNK